MTAHQSASGAWRQSSRHGRAGQARRLNMQPVASLALAAGAPFVTTAAAVSPPWPPTTQPATAPVPVALGPTTVPATNPAAAAEGNSLPWLDNLSAGIAEAQRLKQPIVVDVGAEWCGWC